MSNQDVITIDIEGLEEIEKKFSLMQPILKKAIPVITTRALLIVKERAQEKCPVGKTRPVSSSYGSAVLRASFWHKLDKDGTSGSVGNNADHMPAIEFGSGLYGEKKAKYLIVPKDKKALSFKNASGQRITVKRVMHPGIKPNPFLFKSLEESHSKVQKEYADGVSELISHARTL